MRRRLLLALLAAWCGVMMATAQTPNGQQSWQELCAELLYDEEVDEDVLEAEMEELSQIAANPIDLNLADPDELCRLPFLSMQQACDIYEYIDRHGRILSLGELHLIKSLDATQLRLLPYFVRIPFDGDPHTKLPDSVFTSSAPVHPTVVATAQIPFYTREGDRNGYLGYKYKHELRASLKVGSHVTMALTGAQDAGEPFFSGPNKWGYDSYTGYMELKNVGFVEQAVIGNFRPQAGLGLVLGNTFFAGRNTLMQSFGRTTRHLKPYAGRSELSAMCGAATVLRLSPQIKVMAYGSFHPVDATLQPNGAVATLLKSSYHRTPQELSKRHNTWQTDAGAHLTVFQRNFQGGLMVAYTGFDRPLQPDSSALFRRYNPRGRHFFSTSADAFFLVGRWNLAGEAALDGHGHGAMVATAAYVPLLPFSLTLSGRYFSKGYEGIQARTITTFGYVRNERGLYLGGTWAPLSFLELTGYVDYAYAPEPRYLVSKGAEGWSTQLETLWHLGAHSLSVRHRWTLRPRDNADRTALIRRSTHRVRVTHQINPTDEWTLKTQGEVVSFTNETTDLGWMMSHQVLWQPKKMLAGLTVAYFDTPNYDTRIYLNERQLQYQYSFGGYSGQGLRLSLLSRITLWKYLTFAAQLGHTRYFNRKSIGSGLQLIRGNALTTLQIQVKLKM